MDKGKFRYDSNETIILGLLDKITQDEQIVTFWQNDDDRRIIYKGYVYDLDPYKKTLILKSVNNELLLKLEKDLPIYFHAEERSMIFKSEDYMREGSLLIMPIPKQVKLNENRSAVRFSLKKHLIRSVQHQKEMGLNGSGKFKTFSVNCIDISQTGIALELNASHLTRYLVGEKIIIKEVAGIAIPNVEAEVIHIVPIDGDKKIFRAGLVFTKALNPKVIRDILFTGNVTL